MSTDTPFLPEVPRPVSPELVVPAVPVAEPEPARIVSDKRRTCTVDLVYAVEFQGRRYESVTVRRLTAREVADFVDHLKGHPNPGEVRWPMYDVPDEVLDALDDDDAFELNEVVAGFLPRRFQAATGSD